MAKKEERFEVTFRDGSQLKDEGVRQILVDKRLGLTIFVGNRIWSGYYTSSGFRRKSHSHKVKSKVYSEVKEVELCRIWKRKQRCNYPLTRRRFIMVELQRGC